MTNTDNTAIVPAAPTAPSVQLTALERYGRSGRNLYGELLKFSGKTGTWTSGAQASRCPSAHSSRRSYRSSWPAT
jgi:hypothetical protein